MIQVLKFRSEFDEDKAVVFRKGRFVNNDNLALQAYEITEYGDLEPYCGVIVNLQEKLQGDMGYLNINSGDKGLFEAMESAGIMRNMLKTRISGFCRFPLYQFSKKFLEESVEM